MLSAMAGFCDRDPLSYPIDAREFCEIVEPRRAPRIAFSFDLGVAPVSAAVRTEFLRAITKIAELCPDIEEAAPDCREALEAFAVLRAALVYRQFADLVRSYKAELTEPLVWNVERGAGITADQLLKAEEQRGRAFAAFLDFFDRYDFLITPSASVLPFSNALTDVVEMDGIPLATPIDYLAITFVISLVGMPCVSMPVGRSAGEIPFGVQIVARPRADARLLGFARRLENEPGFRHQWARAATE